MTRDEQAKLLRRCRRALDELLEAKPTLAALRAGDTTLGNLRAELSAYRVPAEPDDYEARVQAYEAQGMTRSDAQGVVDAELMQ